MFENVKQDLQRYILTDDVTSVRRFIVMVISTPSLWVIISYRLGRWVRTKFTIPIFQQVLKLMTKMLHELLCLLTGIQIGFETKIGPGLYIGHSGTLIINSQAVIGSNCNIGIDSCYRTGWPGTSKRLPSYRRPCFCGSWGKNHWKSLNWR